MHSIRACLSLPPPLPEGLTPVTAAVAPPGALSQTDRAALLRMMSAAVKGLEKDEGGPSGRGSKASERVPAAEAAKRLDALVPALVPALLCALPPLQGARQRHLPVTTSQSQHTSSSVHVNEASGPQHRAIGDCPHLDALVPALLPALPPLARALRTEAAALRALVALPSAVARRGVAALAGKSRDFTRALSCLREVIETGTEEDTLSAAAASFADLVGMEGAGNAAETQASAVLQGLFDKITELSAGNGAGEDAAEPRERDFAFALSLQRARHVAARLDPWQRISGIEDMWAALKGALLRRADLDADPLMPPDDDDDDDVARALAEEARLRSAQLRDGESLLVTLLLWRHLALVREVRDAAEVARRYGRGKKRGGGAPREGEEEGSGGESDEENVPEAGPEEIEAEDESSTLFAHAQAAARLRDDVVEVLRAVLAMHLLPQPESPSEEPEDRELGAAAAAAVEAAQARARATHKNHNKYYNSESSAQLAQDLLRPLIVGLWSNAESINKRQASVVMAHIDQSGPAAELVKAFAKKLQDSVHMLDQSGSAAELVKACAKKLQGFSPVKYLEIVMVTLIVCYDKWAHPGDADSGSEAEAAVARGLGAWVPLAHKLAATLGAASRALPRGARLAFPQFMAKGVKYALESAPQQLCFLEGMAPFTRLLMPTQRKYIAALLEECMQGLDEDASGCVDVSQSAFSSACARCVPAQLQQEWEEAEIELEGGTGEVLRQWSALYNFKRMVESDGTARATTGRLGSPASRRRKSGGTPGRRKSGGGAATPGSRARPASSAKTSAKTTAARKRYVLLLVRLWRLKLPVASKWLDNIDLVLYRKSGGGAATPGSCARPASSAKTSAKTTAARKRRVSELPSVAEGDSDEEEEGEGESEAETEGGDSQAASPPARRVSAAATAAAKQRRQSGASQGSQRRRQTQSQSQSQSSQPASQGSARKRGRAAAADSDEDGEPVLEETRAPKPKRQRKSGGGGSGGAARRRSRKPQLDDHMEEDETQGDEEEEEEGEAEVAAAPKARGRSARARAKDAMEAEEDDEGEAAGEDANDGASEDETDPMFQDLAKLPAKKQRQRRA
ncbi:hypothetical protein JKP88DRAFT_331060 [Tribonema minus]|uniref:Uncharacterized protein n=1 Tax=Tribonema minus TaxID=303371 RepID=A0A835YMF9_9STRA|nr:hypothetical protein JKP88DRAFT_331060 [Tribonema minus]